MRFFLFALVILLTVFSAGCGHETPELAYTYIQSSDIKGEDKEISEEIFLSSNDMINAAITSGARGYSFSEADAIIGLSHRANPTEGMYTNAILMLTDCYSRLPEEERTTENLEVFLMSIDERYRDYIITVMAKSNFFKSRKEFTTAMRQIGKGRKDSYEAMVAMNAYAKQKFALQSPPVAKAN